MTQDHDSQQQQSPADQLRFIGTRSLQQLDGVVNGLVASDRNASQATDMIAAELAIRHVLLTVLTNPDDVLGQAIRNMIKESVLEALKESAE